MGGEGSRPGRKSNHLVSSEAGLRRKDLREAQFKDDESSKQKSVSVCTQQWERDTFCPPPRPISLPDCPWGIGLGWASPRAKNGEERQTGCEEKGLIRLLDRPADACLPLQPTNPPPPPGLFFAFFPFWEPSRMVNRPPMHSNMSEKEEETWGVSWKSLFSPKTKGQRLLSLPLLH